MTYNLNQFYTKKFQTSNDGLFVSCSYALLSYEKSYINTCQNIIHHFITILRVSERKKKIFVWRVPHKYTKQDLDDNITFYQFVSRCTFHYYQQNIEYFREKQCTIKYF